MNLAHSELLSSDIFKTSFGYHVVKVFERRSESLTPLADVRNVIERELARQKQDEVLETFVDKLREKATVVLDPSES